MADAPAAPPKKKGKLKKLMVMGIAVLGLLGSGIGAGLYAAGSGMVGSAHAAEKEDPNRPKLVPRKGEKDVAPAGSEHGGENDSPDPHRYQASYYPIDQSFTANLGDSEGVIQVGLGVSTYYDEKVGDNLKKNDMPVRSAVLMVLAQQNSDTLQSQPGKEALQRQLKDAINQTLRQKEGFGGIDNVYFTSFVIQ